MQLAALLLDIDGGQMDLWKTKENASDMSDGDETGKKASCNPTLLSRRRKCFQKIERNLYERVLHLEKQLCVESTFHLPLFLCRQKHFQICMWILKESIIHLFLSEKLVSTQKRSV